MSTPSRGGPADWTIMLYIAADDTLANFAVKSLQQLDKSASAPALEGEANVVVAAQFDFRTGNENLPDEETKRSYLFKEDSDRDLYATRKFPPPLKLADKLVKMPETVKAPETAKTSKKTNIAQKEALQEFLRTVYNDKYQRYKAKHYALILWGHGPELLLQPGASNPTDSSNGMYITPKELREVLCDWKAKHEGAELDIVGFDACFMSMFEMAYELRGVAKYMVASQEEIPDASFPYDCLVELFRKCGNNTTLLLKEGVQAYVSTYQDCICNINTGMKAVTLSALQLDKCEKLRASVDSLACALLKAKKESGLPDLLIKARRLSHDYAAGLYVDLYEFCSKLSKSLEGKVLGWQVEISDACTAVLGALKVSHEGDSLILANGSVNKLGNVISNNSHDTRSHGVSIYLPYLTQNQYAEVSKPLVKGGELTHGAKGYTDILNGATTEYLMCARRNLILDTESYYKDLLLANETHWYDFITGQWTRALMEEVPAELDYHYSAQQSWMNMTREKVESPSPYLPETLVSPEAEMCVAK